MRNALLDSVIKSTSLWCYKIVFSCILTHETIVLVMCIFPPTFISKAPYKPYPFGGPWQGTHHHWLRHSIEILSSFGISVLNNHFIFVER